MLFVSFDVGVWVCLLGFGDLVVFVCVCLVVLLVYLFALLVVSGLFVCLFCVCFV